MELLLVKGTHPLAPTIYELEEKYSHLKTDEERAEKVQSVCMCVCACMRMFVWASL
jgi:hypothetical protein